MNKPMIVDEEICEAIKDIAGAVWVAAIGVIGVVIVLILHGILG